MKLLFFGDMAPTGFGSVTTDLGRMLIERGIDVRFLSQNDFGTLPEPFASRTLDVRTFGVVEPDMTDIHGGITPPDPDWISAVISGGPNTLARADGTQWGVWKPDALLLLGDFYGVRLIAQPLLGVFAEIPTFHYVPIEGHDLPPLWKEIWRVIRPIAMSRFGQDEIEKITGERPPLVYHGVDTDTFRPISPSNVLVIGDKIVLSSKERCKALFGFNPRARVLLRCDRNMPRKAYPALLRALEPVMAERPDVVLALKTQLWDQGGFLSDSISKLPTEVANRVRTFQGDLPRKALCALYNAADVYVSNSAEGFGLTLAEAEACGVPTVGVDYSAVPEVIGPAGTVVPVGTTWDNGYAHYWALPDPAAFGQAVAYLLDHPARAREMGAAGPRHIAANFTWAKAADALIGVLNDRVGAHTAAMVAA